MSGILMRRLLGHNLDVFMSTAAYGLAWGECHFNNGKKKYRGQRDCPGHGRVVLDPKRGQAWVTQRYKCGRKQMNKGGRNKDACSEVPRSE
jgi:hypothetical protein